MSPWGGIERRGGEPPSPFEEAYSFSRVSAAGGFVFVGGTTSINEYGVVEGATPYEQAVIVLRKVLHELSRFGCSVADVVSSRIYVVDITRADDVGRAHAELFGDARPLMTMVEVARLIDPRMLVEIETVAVRPA